MPSYSFRIGPADVALSVDSSTSVPDVNSLTFTASGTTATNLVINDANLALSASITYQVIVGLVGRDATNGGYTISRCSPSSGNLVITAGQGILVTVANANWPANFNKAICAAIFLKEGSSDFKLAEFAYIDPSTDFKHMIKSRPVAGAQEYTSTLLQAATVDTNLGDRAPLGVTYSTLTPTQGGVTVTRNVSQVTLSPDTGTDVVVSTAKTASISFDLLPNDVLDVVRGNAGTYAEYTSGGLTIKEAQMSLSTAKARITGNRPFKLILPPDALGVQEVRLYLGCLTQNQEGNTETWSRDNATPISYNYQAAGLDRLLNNVHTEVVFRQTT